MDPSSQATVSFHLEASGMAAGRPGAQGQGQRGAGGPSVRSLQCCGALLFGGCSDGSIRCWLRLKGSIEEVYRHTGAHTGAVNSISLAGGDDASDDNLAAPFSYSAQRYTKTLVSAGDDCSIKVWRIHCSGDY
jgi:WD40 repeat protein